MNQQFDFFSQSVNLFRNFSTALLSSSEELIALQLDSAQASITRGSDHLRAACSDLNAMQQPLLSSDAVRLGMCNAIRMVRDNVLATSDYQLEALNLMQHQGSKLQKVVADSLKEHLADARSVGTFGVRTNKVENLSPKLAA
jgi:hypothetical protein